jgi:hypothetical protein
MSATIKLSDIRAAMEETDDYSEYFLDRRTGEILLLNEDIKYVLDNEEDLADQEDWMQEVIQKFREIEDTDDCLRLPDRFEIHEYRIMEGFIETITDYRIQQELLYAIKGKGAFRNFRDRVRRRGIEQKWYDYRDKEFREIAIHWLEAHNLAYTDD